jgi:hypothetical protein
MAGEDCLRKCCLAVNIYLVWERFELSPTQNGVILRNFEFLISDILISLLIFVFMLHFPKCIVLGSRQNKFEKSSPCGRVVTELAVDENAEQFYLLRGAMDTAMFGY